MEDSLFSQMLLDLSVPINTVPIMASLAPRNNFPQVAQDEF